MKKSYKVFFFYSVLIVLTTGFQGCNDNSESTAAKQTPANGNEIAESELPPGKLVIEDDKDYNYKPVENVPFVPVSGTGKDKTNAHVTVTPPPTLSRLDQLKKVYKNLMVFHADTLMEVNKPRLATLVLSRNESAEKIKIEVLEESMVSDDAITMDTTMDFGSKMKARLIPFGGSKLDNSFEIEALGSDEQSFRNDRKKIIWQWKITPLKEGKYDLKLSIQIIEKDGEAVYLPARNINVTIYAKNEKLFTKVGNFISDKYEWIITAILLPIFIAWLSSKIRFKNTRPPQNMNQ